MKQKKLVVGLAIALAVLIAIVGVVLIVTKPETQVGDKSVEVTVVFKDKSEKELEIKTDAEYLGEALYSHDKEIFTEEEYKSGYYTVIYGEKADFNVDKGWWCVTKDGEMTTVGMNEQPITDGDKFEITYTVD